MVPRAKLVGRSEGDRVLRVLRVIARTNVGGPALHVSILTARLDRGRFESLLATGQPERNEGDMFELRPDLRAEVGDRLVRIPQLRRAPLPTSDVFALAALRRTIREFRPHIVHTHTTKAGTLGRLAAIWEKVPVIVHTFHGTVFEGHFKKGLGRGIAAWERWLGGRTDALLAVSPAVAKQVVDVGIDRDRVEVVPLGLDLDRFARCRRLPDDARPVVTMVARLAPVKDVPLFLEAMAICRSREPDLEVRIVGDGPLREELTRCAPSYVTFLGNRADLPELLADTAVAVLTSRSEGSPVALIEALAAGRPVVAVPVGGVVDILSGRPGAELTASRSPQDIAGGVLRALEEPELQRGAEKGRNAVLEEFSATRLVKDVQALYERLWARKVSDAR